MSTTQRQMFALMLENKLLNLRGTNFEDFVCDIYEQAYGGDFQRVRAAGKAGDKKCDGYLKSEEILLQSYAPRGTVPSKLQKKILEDFEGAKKHWPDMKRWRFVHNDLEGLDVNTVQLLMQLDKDNPDIVVDQCPPSEIKSFALKMSDENLTAILGDAADRATMQRYGYPEIAAVVDRIALDHTDTNHGPLTIPPENKLKMNKLGEPIKALLSLAEGRDHLFREYFQDSSNVSLGDRISHTFQSEYVRLKHNISDPSAIFFGLVEFVGGLNRDPREQAAAMGLISYLFHSCDIFESVEEDTVAT